MSAEGHVGLHVKCSLLLLDFNQNWNMSTNFSKTVKFYEYPFGGSLVPACGQTEITKITSEFFAISLRTRLKSKV
jgi:hypothetical protein